MGKSLSSDSARARFAEAKRSVETCSAGRAGAHPYRRRRSDSALSFPIARRFRFVYHNHRQIELIF
jgi:hypothetical protein